ncbi:MAG: hypothetical protein JNK99_13370, partial [Candidatus Accumulibacter sp.]|nr:hypothetical protein [Accumulibacter sp.]
MATVTTDKLDYPPGSTASINMQAVTAGSTVQFQVRHILNPGADGLYGTEDDILDDTLNASGTGHDPWYVTDGDWWVVSAGSDGLAGTPDDVISGDLDQAVDGNVLTSWYVSTDDSVNETFLVTARTAGEDGVYGTADDQSATTTFTDKASIDLDQWKDGPAPDASTAADEWTNQNLNPQQSHYTEGEFIPYRARMEGLTQGNVYTTFIDFDTTKADAGPADDHAIDYLGTYNYSFPQTRTETQPDPANGVSGLSNGTTTLDIPIDPRVAAGNDGIAGNSDDIVQIAGHFTAWGGVTFLGLMKPGTDTNFGTSDDIAYLVGADGSWNTADDRIVRIGTDLKPATGDDTVIDGDGFVNASEAYIYTGNFSGTSTASLAPIFTFNGDGVTGNNAVLAWGGHIATSADWGTGNSASDISGSPYHMRVLDFVDSGDSSVNSGNQDRSLSAGAVAPLGRIAIVKDALPNDLGDFSFTFTNVATGVSTTFYLDDDAGVSGGDNSLLNQRLFVDLANGDYTISEGTVTGWALTSISAVENGAQDSTSGDISSVNLGGRTATITVAGGEAWTVTFTNDHRISPEDYVNIQKTVDADEDGTFAETESILEGGVGDQKADYKYVLQNDLSIGYPVTITSLVDDRGTVSTSDDIDVLAVGTLTGDDGDGWLEPGEIWTYVVQDVQLPVGDVGDSVVNKATATAVDDTGLTGSVYDTATVTYENVTPFVTIDKSAPATVSEGGEDVTYTFTITADPNNASTDPLTVTSLTDT